MPPLSFTPWIGRGRGDRAEAWRQGEGWAGTVADLPLGGGGCKEASRTHFHPPPSLDPIWLRNGAWGWRACQCVGRGQRAGARGAERWPGPDPGQRVGWVHHWVGAFPSSRHLFGGSIDTPHPSPTPSSLALPEEARNRSLSGPSAAAFGQSQTCEPSGSAASALTGSSSPGTQTPRSFSASSGEAARD